MRPDGSHETYDKRHLFRMGREDDFFTSGQYRTIIEIKRWKICPLICYDLRFPIWNRNRWSMGTLGINDKRKEFLAQYDVLLYVANWPERRAHPWKTLLMARAIENQAFAIGVNRIGMDGNGIDHSGDSAVINFKGEKLSQTEANDESIETVSLNYAELEEFRKIFPVGMDADDFTVG